jgi:hypothetical protein
MANAIMAILESSIKWMCILQGKQNVGYPPSLNTKSRGNLIYPNRLSEGILGNIVSIFSM